MPGKLTIIGLGPGNRADRTIGAVEALANAEKIVLRTAIHPGVDDIASDPRTETCDDIYERGLSFPEVYSAVAERVIEHSRSFQTVFAVPGHPFFGEHSVANAIALAEAAGVPVSMESAVSAIDAVASALRIDPLSTELQIIDAAELALAIDREPFSSGAITISPIRPVLVGQVYSRAIATATKLALGRFYADDHPIAIVTAAGVPGIERIDRVELHELDRTPVDHLTSVYLSPIDVLDAARSPWTLSAIGARLRAPDGCPWDRKQTHQSLRGALIEEAYEVVEALDNDDPEHFAEELGDLLLQVALHAQIAEEAGDFTIEDVYEHINRKLVRRHPHVFGDAVAETPDDVVTTWDAVKAEEKKRKGQSETERSPFDKLPKSMPILTKIAQLSPNQMVGAANSDDLGDRLLQAVENVIGVGLDPETVLANAYLRKHKSGNL